jgi:hypothetical protein
MKVRTIIAGLAVACIPGVGAFAQQPLPKDSSLPKSTEVVDEKEEKNRNVMLNAANNTGPREVNIGLPSTVGGITILENNLPVVYYFWPELPTRTWRQSSSLGKTGLLKLGEVAITTGDLGYAVNSYTRLGTDKLHLNGNLSSNNFGWLKGDVNISGPLAKNWFFTAGIYENFDPSTFDLMFTKYADKTQIYRAGITKRFNNNKGEISLLYKYASSASLSSASVFQYEEGGNVKELSNFRIGRDSYFARDGVLRFKDILNGNAYQKSLASDAATTSHTIDLIGNYKLNNGWVFDFSTRYHSARAVSLSTTPLSIIQQTGKGDFTYQDNGEVYEGDVQTVLALNAPRIPVTAIQSRFDLSKKTAAHKWRFGLTESYYKVDKFISNRSFFYQEVAANPRRLMRNTEGATSNTDEYGFYNYNVGGEYHNGFENKLALFFSDDWTISDKFSFSYGTNLQYHKLKGDFHTQTRTPGYTFGNDPLTYFDNNWFHTGLSLNATYKLTNKFGFLGEFIYTERHGVLENYSGAYTPTFDKTKSPMGRAGVYFNHEKFSLVSALTYLTRNNYQTRLNLVNPDNTSQSDVASVHYDIQTIGWTTDIVATPVKNFSLHYLITLQNPVYKNYSFQAFGKTYSYDDKNVLEISKVLMEIDPSYTLKQLKLWASLRYFSKQFANLNNVLYFKGRWETFAGANYKLNKKYDLGLTVVNLLNQRGAKGSISGTELITDPSAYYGRKLVAASASGTYIRPLTIEFSLNINL